VKEIRKANINIVSIHHHMVEEKPRIIFLHYWGKGKPTVLAQGIKATLDTEKNE
jgi:hypothetical protein